MNFTHDCGLSRVIEFVSETKKTGVGESKDVVTDCDSSISDAKDGVKAFVRGLSQAFTAAEEGSLCLHASKLPFRDLSSSNFA